MITFTQRTLAALALGAAVLATAPASAGMMGNGSANGYGNGTGNGSANGYGNGTGNGGANGYPNGVGNGDGNSAPNGQVTPSDAYNLRIVGIELPAKALAR